MYVISANLTDLKETAAVDFAISNLVGSQVIARTKLHHKDLLFFKLPVKYMQINNFILISFCLPV